MRCRGRVWAAVCVLVCAVLVLPSRSPRLAGLPARASACEEAAIVAETWRAIDQFCEPRSLRQPGPTRANFCRAPWQLREHRLPRTARRFPEEPPAAPPAPAVARSGRLRQHRFLSGRRPWWLVSPVCPPDRRAPNRGTATCLPAHYRATAADGGLSTEMRPNQSNRSLERAGAVGRAFSALSGVVLYARRRDRRPQRDRRRKLKRQRRRPRRRLCLRRRRRRRV